MPSVVAWCLLVLAIAVDDKVMIGCVDAGSSYSFSDCALAQSPLMISIKSGDVVTIRNCTVARITFSNVSNVSLSMTNITIASPVPVGSPGSPLISFDGTVSDSNITIQNGTLSASQNVDRLVSLGRSDFVAGASCYLNATNLRLSASLLVLDGAYNFSFITSACFNRSGAPPLVTTEYITDSVFVFSECTAVLQGTLTSVIKFHGLTLPGSVLNMTFTRMSVLVVNSTISANTSLTPLFAAVAAYAPQSACTSAGTFNDLLFALMGCLVYGPSVVVVGSLTAPSATTVAASFWSMLCSNTTVLLVDSFLVHSADVVAFVGTDTTLVNPNTTLVVSSFAVQIQNTTLRRNSTAGGDKCLSAMFTKRLINISILISGGSSLDGCRLVVLQSAVLLGFYLMMNGGSATGTRGPPSVSYANSSVAITQCNVTDMQFMFTNVTVTTSIAFPLATPMIVILSSNMDGAGFVVDGGSFFSGPQFAYVSDCNMTNMTLLACEGSTIRVVSGYLWIRAGIAETLAVKFTDAILTGYAYAGIQVSDGMTLSCFSFAALRSLFNGSVESFSLTETTGILSNSCAPSSCIVVSFADCIIVGRSGIYFSNDQNVTATASSTRTLIVTRCTIVANRAMSLGCYSSCNPNISASIAQMVVLVTNVTQTVFGGATNGALFGVAIHEDLFIFDNFSMGMTTCGFCNFASNLFANATIIIRDSRIVLNSSFSGAVGIQLFLSGLSNSSTLVNISSTNVSTSDRLDFSSTAVSLAVATLANLKLMVTRSLLIACVALAVSSPYAVMFQFTNSTAFSSSFVKAVVWVRAGDGSLVSLRDITFLAQAYVDCVKIMPNGSLLVDIQNVSIPTAFRAFISIDLTTLDSWCTSPSCSFRLNTSLISVYAMTALETFVKFSSLTLTSNIIHNATIKMTNCFLNDTSLAIVYSIYVLRGLTLQIVNCTVLSTSGIFSGVAIYGPANASVSLVSTTVNGPNAPLISGGNMTMIMLECSEGSSLTLSVLVTNYNAANDAVIVVNLSRTTIFLKATLWSVVPPFGGTPTVLESLTLHLRNQSVILFNGYFAMIQFSANVSSPRTLIILESSSVKCVMIGSTCSSVIELLDPIQVAVRADATNFSGPFVTFIMPHGPAYADTEPSPLPMNGTITLQCSRWGMRLLTVRLLFRTLPLINRTTALPYSTSEPGLTCPLDQSFSDTSSLSVSVSRKSKSSTDSASHRDMSKSMSLSQSRYSETRRDSSSLSLSTDVTPTLSSNQSSTPNIPATRTRSVSRTTSISHKTVSRAFTTREVSGSVTGSRSLTTTATTTRAQSVSPQHSKASESGTSSTSLSCLSVDALLVAGGISKIEAETMRSAVANASTIRFDLFVQAAFVLVSFPVSSALRILAAGNASASLGRVGNVSVVAGDDISGTSISVLVIASSAINLHALTLVGTNRLLVTVHAAVEGTCLPQGLVVALTFVCDLSPIKVESSAQRSAQTTFRAASVTTSVFGNPIMAMSNTGTASTLALADCLFSDVDPLDPPISPTGFAIGDPVGQYSRGAAVAALALYGAFALAAGAVVIFKHVFWSSPWYSSLAQLRMPSGSLILVSLFHQGLATTGVSLCRGAWHALDIFLGLLALVAASLVTAYSINATTRSFHCRLQPVDEDTLAEENSTAEWFPASFAKKALLHARWDKHWVDASKSQFKRRHLLLMDGLRLPWWSAVELGSGLSQGAVLGLRINSIGVCRGQMVCVLLLSCAILAAALFFRPCGSMSDNLFLILSKLGAAVIALLVLLEVLTEDDMYSVFANCVAVAASGIAACQTILQMLLVSFRLTHSTVLRRAMDALRLRKHVTPRFAARQAEEAATGGESPQIGVGGTKSFLKLLPRQAEVRTQLSPGVESQQLDGKLQKGNAQGNETMQRLLNRQLAALVLATRQYYQHDRCREEEEVQKRLALLVSAACTSSVISLLRARSGDE